MSKRSQIRATRRERQQQQPTPAAIPSFRPGLTASPMVMLPGEKMEDFLLLGNGLRSEYKPVSLTEDALVTKLIESLWLSTRAVKQQQRLLLDPHYKEEDFDLFVRYQAAQDRCFSRSLRDLLFLRKNLRQQEIGFVSQKRTAVLEEARIRNLNARSAATESLTARRSVRFPPLTSAAAPEKITPILGRAIDFVEPKA